jgi:hypothetical protein
VSRELFKSVLRAFYQLTDEEAEKLTEILEHGVKDISDMVFIKYVSGARIGRLMLLFTMQAGLRELKEILEALRRGEAGVEGTDHKG